MEKRIKLTLNVLGQRSRRLARSTAFCASLGALAAAIAMALGAATTAHAVESACPNEAIRQEQTSTYLGDCRAYELVSPPMAISYLSGAEGPNKGNDTVEGGQASRSGDGLGWYTYYPPAMSQHGGFFYRSSRGEGGWQTEEVTPGQSTWQLPDGVSSFVCQDNVFFSAELEAWLLVAGEGSDGPEGAGFAGGGGEKEYCGNNEPALVPNEPRGVQNLFLTSPGQPAYRLVNVAPSGVQPTNADFQDATPDFSHIVFSENAALTPEALTKEDLYEWFDGDVHLVSVLPNGKTAEGTIVDGTGFVTAAAYAHAVSNDGSRVFFRAAGKLYVRLHAEAAPHQGPIDPAECIASTDACTIQIDESRVGGSGGGGRFLAANAEGTRVFFMDESSAKLTGDTQEFSLENLYEYDLESGDLTDLTSVSKAKVLGFSAMSEDGSYLYFAAEGVLATGATLNKPNLYLAHDGTITFIATVESKGSTTAKPWQAPEELPQFDVADTSPDGAFFAFGTTSSLTGYDNTDRSTGHQDEEVFLYDAASSSLNCASCDPAGAAPAGNARFFPVETISSGPAPGRLRSLVFDDGRVLFETPDALVSRDINEVGDVYEYQQGEVRLVSSGTSPDPSFIEEASANGQDVFFVTTQALTRNDTGNGLSIYDARVDGGFPEPSKTPPCVEEACRGPYPVGEGSSEPTSNTFHGPGNLVPANPKTRHGSTRTQFTKALKACRHRYRRKRARHACESQARRQYAGMGQRKPKSVKERGAR